MNAPALRLLALAAVLWVSLLGPAPRAEPLQPATGWSGYGQVEEPALTARKLTALGRSESAQAFFAGELALGEAFPELDGAPLGSEAFLAGRLAALDLRAEDRAVERAQALPSLGTSWRDRKRQELRAATFDAEDRAEGEERRVLLGLRRLLRELPRTADEQLQPLLDDLELRRRAAEAAFASSPPEMRAAPAREAARLAEEARRWRALVGAIRTAAAGGARDVPFDEDLLALQGPDGAEAALRLELARLLVPESDRERIEGELVAWLEGGRLAAVRSDLAEARAELDAVLELLGEKDEAASPPAGEPEAPKRAESTSLLERLGSLVAREPVGKPAPPALLADGVPSAARTAELLAGRQEARRAAQAHLDRVPAPRADDLPGRIRVEAARSALEAAELRVRTAERLSAYHDRTVEERDALLRARASEEEARRAAQAARDQALQDEQSRKVASMLTVLADLQAESGSALRRRAEVAAADLGERSDHEARIVVVERAAAAEPEPGRAARASMEDAARSGRTLVSELRAAVQSASVRLAGLREERSREGKAVTEARRAIEEARAFAAALEGDPETRRALLSAADDAESATDERELATSGRLQDLRDHRGALLDQLDRARDAYLVLRDGLGGVVRSESRSLFLRDVRQEVELLPLHLVNRVRRRVLWVLQIPDQPRGLDRLWSVFGAGLRFGVAILVWWWLRRRDTLLARVVHGWVADRAPPLYRRALDALLNEEQRTARALIDLIAAFLLAGALVRPLPELAIVIFLVSEVALYRFATGLFGLLVAKRPTFRPALAYLPADAYSVASAAFRAVALWWVARSFTAHLVGDLLRTPALGELALLGLNLGLLVAAFLLLQAFEPVVRRIFKRGGGESRTATRLATGPRTGLLRWLHGLVGLVLLSAAWALAAVQDRAAEGTWLGRAMNRVERYRLAREPTEEGERLPLPPALVRALSAPDIDADLVVERKALDGRLDEAIAAWEREGTRGLVVVTGPRGGGKRTWLERVARRLRDQGRSVHAARFTQRISDEAGLCAWMAREFELGEVADKAALVERIEALSPRVFVLEGAQWTFLRAIGGFTALRALLDTLGRVSRKHLWIVGVHRPAWAYLQRLGDQLKFDMVRAVIPVQPMSEEQLRAMVERRMAAEDWSADFSRLTPRTALLGEEGPEQVERSRQAFYRLLAEASEGNPAAALRQFARCGAASPDGSRRLLIRLEDALQPGSIGELDTIDLFTLAALHIHKALTNEELERVNNLGPELVDASVQYLESRSLVDRRDGVLRIAEEWGPSVARTLRRSHVLHWSE